MRCSSCEPLLDRYVEGTLTPRQMIDTGKHLAECVPCRELMNELKVVDALLFTTQVPDLPQNFTFAVMAEVNTMPAPRARAHPVWSFLALYSAAAWMAAVIGMALGGVSPKAAFGAIAGALAQAGTALGALGTGISHSFSHSTPTLAAMGLGVLVLDAALAAAVALVYFVVRPRLAARLAPVPERRS